MEALKKKQLGPWAMQNLLDDVEKKNVLRLDKAKRSQKAIEITSLMVPPMGPAVAYRNERGTESIYRKAFRRLLKSYQASPGKSKKYQALAKAFKAHLTTLIKKSEKVKNPGRLIKRERAQLKKELASIQTEVPS